MCIHLKKLSNSEIVFDYKKETAIITLLFETVEIYEKKWILF